MTEQYYQEYSMSLARGTEYVTYGTSGKIMIAFPSQNGNCRDYEAFGLLESLKPWIEAGQLQLVCVGSVDTETWSAQDSDMRRRIELQERWFYYITEELWPTLHARNPRPEKGMLTGVSMGATHAAITFFRRPDLFDTVISLSGLYDASYFFGSYIDPLVYDNSPVHFLANMPDTHPYMRLYRDSRMIFCVGRGPWEEDMLAGTRQLDTVLCRKGIPAWFDYWGYDVSHDWVWWKKQLPYFVENILGEAPKKRCAWCESDDEMRAYHDNEWGTPVKDDRTHFEYLCLESLQCGLTWSYVLHKRGIFRACFADFEPEQVAAFTDADVARILETPDMLKSEKKVRAVIHNARVFLDIVKAFGNFNAYLNTFTNGKMRIRPENEPMPVSDAVSEALAADLKKRGFKFIGPVTMYAYLQSVGAVNDHDRSCFRFAEVQEGADTEQL